MRLRVLAGIYHSRIIQALAAKQGTPKFLMFEVKDGVMFVLFWALDFWFL